MRLLLLGILILTGCAHVTPNSSNLFSSLCEQTFTGKVVSDDPQDDDWRKEVLTIGPVNCATGNTVSIPLAVGTNTSRTWVITGQGSSLELRHQHVLEDGSPDPVSEYGGPIRGEPILSNNTWTMYFPADQKTIDIFNANDLAVSTTNVWSLELTSGERLVYELNRKNRNFRAEFDLSNK